MSIVVLLFLLGGTAFANITVSGRVVDNASEPLIGVSVQVQGTSSGTITDTVILANAVPPSKKSNTTIDIRLTCPIEFCFMVFVFFRFK